MSNGVTEAAITEAEKMLRELYKTAKATAWKKDPEPFKQEDPGRLHFKTFCLGVSTAMLVSSDIAGGKKKQVMFAPDDIPTSMAVFAIAAARAAAR